MELPSVNVTKHGDRKPHVLKLEKNLIAKTSWWDLEQFYNKQAICFWLQVIKIGWLFVLTRTGAFVVCVNDGIFFKQSEHHLCNILKQKWRYWFGHWKPRAFSWPCQFPIYGSLVLKKQQSQYLLLFKIHSNNSMIFVPWTIMYLIMFLLKVHHRVIKVASNQTKGLQVFLCTTN